MFMDDILTSQPEGVEDIRVSTDGSASNFKNKFVMAGMYKLSERHGVKLSGVSVLWVMGKRV